MSLVSSSKMVVFRTATPYPSQRDGGSASPSVVSVDSDATVLLDMGQGVAPATSPIPSEGDRNSVVAAPGDAFAGAPPRANISQAGLDQLIDRQVSLSWIFFFEGGLWLSGIISSPRFCLHPTLLLNDEFSYVHFRATPGGAESVDRIDEVESTSGPECSFLPR